MKWLHFILSHSIFISFCAAALCLQTFQLLHFPVNYLICVLAFFATLSGYNLYWLISKYHFSKDTRLTGFFVKHFSNIFFFLFAAIGLSCCLYFIPSIMPVVSIGVMLTLIYSVPLWPVKILSITHKAGFLKTLLLAFTWAYVTVMMPAHNLVSIHDLSLELLFAARFLFMLMLCLIFDSRDINVDKINSLRSLATDVSRETLRRIMAIVFILYLAAGFLLRYHFHDNAQFIAFFITGLATLYVYMRSLKKQGYFFYYFIVDGLMLFSTAATFVASI